jgi:DNA-binding beta-propeller fold protein YncE
MFDTKTLQTIKTITVGGAPDGILYDPGSQQVFVFSHRAPNATVIKASDGSVVGTVDLGGAPEGAVSDGKGHIFVDIEDTNEVATVDPAALKVTARWGLKGATGPAGLGIDQEHGRLFVGCHSQQMVILDTETGSVIATLPIGSGVDATVFDPGTHEAFASTGDGKLTVIREIDPTNFEVEQTVATATGARTCALDSKQHQVITVTMVPQPGQPATQPTTGPGGGGRGRLNGTFTILVVGR